MAAQQRQSLSGPAGNLEAVVEQGSDTPSFVAIVCHPHPLFGGTMDNKVVTSLSRLARDQGAVVVRFNFRGGMPARELLLVAPPVHHYPFDDIEQTGCPVTVVQGDDDEVVPAEQVFRWAEATPLAPDLIRFPDCGHFFHGKLVELKQAAASHLPG